jgi:hypothetical protein
MKLVLTHLLCLVLGGAVVWFLPKKPAVARPSVQEGETLHDLGLRAGDLLLSVNGVDDHRMFDAMAEGLERGDVCVVFERKSKKQEICLKRG